MSEIFSFCFEAEFCWLLNCNNEAYICFFLHYIGNSIHPWWWFH
jgi:hypothetical protein